MIRIKTIFKYFFLFMLIGSLFNSCNDTTLDDLRNAEQSDLNKYIKDNHLEDTKDSSGIYYIEVEKGTGDAIIAGYTVMLYYKITLLQDGEEVEIPASGFSTEDSEGRSYEEVPFYVDISTELINREAIQNIAGMHIGLKKMQIGGTSRLIIPSELAFKASDYSSTYGIPRFSTLIAKVYAKKGYPPVNQE